MFLSMCIGIHLFRVDEFGYRWTLCHETWCIHVNIHRMVYEPSICW